MFAIKSGFTTRYFEARSASPVAIAAAVTALARRGLLGR
jgi:hypothetical protein